MSNISKLALLIAMAMGKHGIASLDAGKVGLATLKYHYAGIRSHSPSGAAAHKRAARKRNNIRKRRSH